MVSAAGNAIFISTDDERVLFTVMDNRSTAVDKMYAKDLVLTVSLTGLPAKRVL